MQGWRLDEAAGGTVAIVFTVLSLLAIIFFSEMLPKSVAVLAPMRLSVLGRAATLDGRAIGQPCVAVGRQSPIWPRAV